MKPITLYWMDEIRRMRSLPHKLDDATVLNKLYAYGLRLEKQIEKEFEKDKRRTKKKLEKEEKEVEKCLTKTRILI